VTGDSISHSASDVEYSLHLKRNVCWSWFRVLGRKLWTERREVTGGCRKFLDFLLFVKLCQRKGCEGTRHVACMVEEMLTEL
jgi:hypothetical protein